MNSDSHQVDYHDEITQQPEFLTFEPHLQQQFTTEHELLHSLYKTKGVEPMLIIECFKTNNYRLLEDTIMLMLHRHEINNNSHISINTPTYEHVYHHYNTTTQINHILEPGARYNEYESMKYLGLLHNPAFVDKSSIYHHPHHQNIHKFPQFSVQYPIGFLLLQSTPNINPIFFDILAILRYCLCYYGEVTRAKYISMVERSPTRNLLHHIECNLPFFTPLYTQKCLFLESLYSIFNFGYDYIDFSSYNPSMPILAPPDIGKNNLNCPQFQFHNDNLKLWFCGEKSMMDTIAYKYNVPIKAYITEYKRILNDLLPNTIYCGSYKFLKLFLYDIVLFTKKQTVFDESISIALDKNKERTDDEESENFTQMKQVIYHHYGVSTNYILEYDDFSDELTEKCQIYQHYENINSNLKVAKLNTNSKIIDIEEIISNNKDSWQKQPYYHFNKEINDLGINFELQSNTNRFGNTLSLYQFYIEPSTWLSILSSIITFDEQISQIRAHLSQPSKLTSPLKVSKSMSVFNTDASFKYLSTHHINELYKYCKIQINNFCKILFLLLTFYHFYTLPEEIQNMLYFVAYSYDQQQKPIFSSYKFNQVEQLQCYIEQRVAVHKILTEIGCDILLEDLIIDITDNSLKLRQSTSKRDDFYDNLKIEIIPIHSLYDYIMYYQATYIIPPTHIEVIQYSLKKQKQPPNLMPLVYDIHPILLLNVNAFMVSLANFKTPRASTNVQQQQQKQILQSLQKTPDLPVPSYLTHYHDIYSHIDDNTTTNQYYTELVTQISQQSHELSYLLSSIPIKDSDIYVFNHDQTALDDVNLVKIDLQSPLPKSAQAQTANNQSHYNKNHGLRYKALIQLLDYRQKTVEKRRQFVLHQCFLNKYLLNYFFYSNTNATYNPLHCDNVEPPKKNAIGPQLAVIQSNDDYDNDCLEDDDNNNILFNITSLFQTTTNPTYATSGDNIVKTITGDNVSTDNINNVGIAIDGLETGSVPKLKKRTPKYIPKELETAKSDPNNPPESHPISNINSQHATILGQYHSLKSVFPQYFIATTQLLTFFMNNHQNLATLKNLVTLSIQTNNINGLKLIKTTTNRTYNQLSIPLQQSLVSYACSYEYTNKEMLTFLVENGVLFLTVPKDYKTSQQFSTQKTDKSQNPPDFNVYKDHVFYSLFFRSHISPTKAFNQTMEKTRYLVSYCERNKLPFLITLLQFRFILFHLRNDGCINFEEFFYMYQYLLCIYNPLTNKEYRFQLSYNNFTGELIKKAKKSETTIENPFISFQFINEIIISLYNTENWLLNKYLILQHYRPMIFQELQKIVKILYSPEIIEYNYLFYNPLLNTMMPILSRSKYNTMLISTHAKAQNGEDQESAPTISTKPMKSQQDVSTETFYSVIQSNELPKYLDITTNPLFSIIPFRDIPTISYLLSHGVPSFGSLSYLIKNNAVFSEIDDIVELTTCPPPEIIDYYESTGNTQNEVNLRYLAYSEIEYDAQWIITLSTRYGIALSDQTPPHTRFYQLSHNTLPSREHHHQEYDKYIYSIIQKYTIYQLDAFNQQYRIENTFISRVKHYLYQIISTDSSYSDTAPNSADQINSTSIVHLNTEYDGTGNIFVKFLANFINYIHYAVTPLGDFIDFSSDGTEPDPIVHQTVDALNDNSELDQQKSSGNSQTPQQQQHTQDLITQLFSQLDNMMTPPVSDENLQATQNTPPPPHNNKNEALMYLFSYKFLLQHQKSSFFEILRLLLLSNTYITDIIDENQLGIHTYVSVNALWSLFSCFFEHNNQPLYIPLSNAPIEPTNNTGEENKNTFSVQKKKIYHNPMIKTLTSQQLLLLSTMDQSLFDVNNESSIHKEQLLSLRSTIILNSLENSKNNHKNHKNPVDHDDILNTDVYFANNTVILTQASSREYYYQKYIDKQRNDDQSSLETGKTSITTLNDVDAFFYNTMSPSHYQQYLSQFQSNSTHNKSVTTQLAYQLHPNLIPFETILQHNSYLLLSPLNIYNKRYNELKYDSIQKPSATSQITELEVFDLLHDDLSQIYPTTIGAGDSTEYYKQKQIVKTHEAFVRIQNHGKIDGDDIKSREKKFCAIPRFPHLLSKRFIDDIDQFGNTLTNLLSSQSYSPTHNNPNIDLLTLVHDTLLPYLNQHIVTLPVEYNEKYSVSPEWGHAEDIAHSTNNLNTSLIDKKSPFYSINFDIIILINELYMNTFSSFQQDGDIFVLYSKDMFLQFLLDKLLYLVSLTQTNTNILHTIYINNIKHLGNFTPLYYFSYGVKTITALLSTAVHYYHVLYDVYLHDVSTFPPGRAALSSFTLYHTNMKNTGVNDKTNQTIKKVGNVSNTMAFNQFLIPSIFSTRYIIPFFTQLSSILFSPTTIPASMPPPPDIVAFYDKRYILRLLMLCHTPFKSLIINYIDKLLSYQSLKNLNSLDVFDLLLHASLRTSTFNDDHNEILSLSAPNYQTDLTLLPVENSSENKMVQPHGTILEYIMLEDIELFYELLLLFKKYRDHFHQIVGFLNRLVDGYGNNLIAQLVQLHSNCVIITVETNHDDISADMRQNSIKFTNSIKKNVHNQLTCIINSLNMLIIDFHLDINFKNLSGFTPLMLAVSLKNTSMIKILVYYGADCNITDLCGNDIISIWRYHSYNISNQSQFPQSIKRIVQNEGLLNPNHPIDTDHSFYNNSITLFQYVQNQMSYNEHVHEFILKISSLLEKFEAIDVNGAVLPDIVLSADQNQEILDLIIQYYKLLTKRIVNNNSSNTTTTTASTTSSLNSGSRPGDYDLVPLSQMIQDEHNVIVSTAISFDDILTLPVIQSLIDHQYKINNPNTKQSTLGIKTYQHLLNSLKLNINDINTEIKNIFDTICTKQSECIANDDTDLSQLFQYSQLAVMFHSIDQLLLPRL